MLVEVVAPGIAPGIAPAIVMAAAAKMIAVEGVEMIAAAEMSAEAGADGTIAEGEGEVRPPLRLNQAPTLVPNVAAAARRRKLLAST